jgi:hypothetical protein
MQDRILELRKESGVLRREVQAKTLSYIMAAFGLVAGLAWNEAIKGLIEVYFPLKAGGILAKFVYAIIITTIVVIAGYYLVKLGKKDENPPKNPNI